MFDSLLVLRLAAGDVIRIPLTSVPGQETFSTFVKEAGPCPDGIAIDGKTVYWTTMGVPSVVPGLSGEEGLDYGSRNGGISGAALADGRSFAVVEPGGITTGKQLCADGAGRLYWSDREGCRISSARTDGSDLQDLVINAPDGSKDQECVGVAVDVDAGSLYWTQKGPAKGGHGRIFRAGLTLPEGEDARSRSDLELLWQDLPEPIDLEIHDGFLYWTDRGAEPAGNTLNRAPLPGPGAKGAEPEILARGFREAIGLTIDGDAGVAYVSELGGRIVAVELHPAGEAAAPRVVADLGTPLSGLAGLNSTHEQQD